MDFASKAFLLTPLLVVCGALVGLVGGSILGAIWLRLAAVWLSFPHVPYMAAFRCAFLSNLFNCVLNLSIGFSHGLAIGSLNRLSPGHPNFANFAFAYSPIYFLYTSIFVLIVTAAFFRRVVPDKDPDNLPTFGDTLALAALYYTLSGACFLLLAIFAYLFFFASFTLIGG